MMEVNDKILIGESGLEISEKSRAEGFRRISTVSNLDIDAYLVDSLHKRASIDSNEHNCEQIEVPKPVEKPEKEVHDAEHGSLSEFSGSTGHSLDQKMYSYQIHGRLRHFVSKLTRTHKVCELMSRILRGETTQLADYDLEPLENTLLTSLLSRKYNNSTVDENSVLNQEFSCYASFVREGRLRCQLNLSEAEDKQARQTLMKSFVDFLQHLKLTKRVEENNKFVYKHTTSYLITQFVFEKNLRFSTTTEALFYQFYFEDHANARGLSAMDFCDPLKTNVKNSRKAKSLNTDYLLRILSCEKYRIEVFKYLEGGFEEDYLSATFKKLERLLLSLEESLAKCCPEDESRILSQFIDTRINHRWCKIPWSRSEIRTAIDHFFSYFSEMLMRRQSTVRKNASFRFRNWNDYKVLSLSSLSHKSGSSCEGRSNRTHTVEIQSLGVIFSHKKTKKYTFALFGPSEPNTLYSKLN